MEREQLRTRASDDHSFPPTSPPLYPPRPPFILPGMRVVHRSMLLIRALLCREINLKSDAIFTHASQHFDRIFPNTETSDCDGER